MADAPITIKVDDRIRLLAALLSQTTWPFQEQDQKPHDVHAHAKETRKFLAEHENHEAVEMMQNLLETAQSIDQIFSYAYYLNWPNLRLRGDKPDWADEEFPAQLRNFFRSTKLKDMWHEARDVWEAAEEQSRTALADSDPVPYLAQFFGDLSGLALVFQPNLAFPSDRALGFRLEDELVCICPPRIAWGQNPPWPYDDDPGATTADAMLTYCRVLLTEHLKTHKSKVNKAKETTLPVPNTFRAIYPEWIDQFIVLVTHGMTAIYLDLTLGKPEAASFTMFAKKALGLDVIPSVIEVLARYLEGYREGKFPTFGDYLPVFSKALSIAESMRSK